MIRDADGAREDEAVILTDLDLDLRVRVLAGLREHPNLIDLARLDAVLESPLGRPVDDRLAHRGRQGVRELLRAGERHGVRGVLEAPSVCDEAADVDGEGRHAQQDDQQARHQGQDLPSFGATASVTA